MILEDVEWVDAGESDFESDTWEAGSDGSEDAPYEYRSVYEAIRPALGEAWQRAEPEQIEALLREATRHMTVEEAENFWSTLASVGKQIAPVAAQIAPIAGQVIGGIYGGPAGAAIGGSVGQFAGQALGSLAGTPQGPRPAPTPPMAPPSPPAPAPFATPLAALPLNALPPGLGTVPRPPVATAPVPQPVGGGGTSATTQLLSFLQNPQLLQSILGQLMGSAGRSETPVGNGGATAPFGAFMNTLGVLANQAASESLVESPNASYLYDSQGRLLADPNSPEERAAALLGHLRGPRLQ